jgi:GNAT superfamily N-acetyltransferase
MAIRWDVLEPLVTIPYLPTLGPVHPDAVSLGLFTDVMAIAGSGEFLPHDKDRRWGGRKDEHVLASTTTQEPGLVLLPSLSIRRRRVQVTVYSRGPGTALNRAVELGGWLAGQRDAAAGRLVWFLPPGSDPDPAAACTRVQMRTFNPDDGISGTAADIVPLDEVSTPVRATFSLFAARMAGEGFAFLHARIAEQSTGPMLTCQRDQKIVGAIGPMEIMPDNLGAGRLLPQSFGVLPEYRGIGLGRALWQAAMRWGQQHHAAYQVLQTQTGGASDCLCRSEGLTDLGLVCRRAF